MNRNLVVLNHIWRYPGSHRKEIALSLGLRQNLVTDVVKELIAGKWVIEGAMKNGSKGRSPISLHINDKAKKALAVTYNRDLLIGALVNADGSIFRKIEKNHHYVKPRDIAGLIGKTTEELGKSFPGTVIGVGLADPGMVDHTCNQVARSSTFPEWRDVCLAQMVAKATGFPVLLEDHTRTGALGEYLSRPEWRQDNVSMIYLSYSNGVGFALVNQAGPWKGDGLAGEIGHVVIEDSDILCNCCGARGCLEALTGPVALKRNCEELLQLGTASLLQTRKKMTVGDVFQAYADGDRLARTLIHETVPKLGIALSLLVSAFHPTHLVIGGETELVSQCLADILRKDISERILPEIAGSVKITAGAASDDISLAGAGLMVYDEVIARNGRGLVSY